MLKKLDRLRKELQSIKSELEDLEKFRDTTPLKKFKRQLQGELSTVKQEIKTLQMTKQEKQEKRKERIQKANQNRSAKNKRVWNYVKSIRDNYFPNKPVKEVRSALKKHRKGLETDIPDVAWRNPSP